MCGDDAFESVPAARECESGGFVHLVDSEYDAGDVVSQERGHLGITCPAEPARLICRR
jgi:folate-dependent phosphoribosylglycinamide formyltransferase PurN